jgi:hypothetical protein
VPHQTGTIDYVVDFVAERAKRKSPPMRRDRGSRPGLHRTSRSGNLANNRATPTQLLARSLGATVLDGGDRPGDAGDD